jgi:L-threonylcarbamoyladenylate synthase
MLQKFGKVEKVREKVGDLPHAPGQLPSHYAPLTPLTLLEKPRGFHTRARQEIRPAQLPRRGRWLLRHSSRMGAHRIPQPRQRQARRGRHPFVLRHADTADEAGLDAIIAEPVSETGLGVAIMDRLRRASAKPDRS